MKTLKAQVPDFKLNVGGQEFNSWFYRAPPEVKLENLTDPEFWAHVSRQLRPLDIIDVVARDQSYDAQYRVAAIMGFIVTLRPLRTPVRSVAADVASLSGEGVEVVAHGARVQFVPRGEQRWRVLTPSGEVVSHGHATREAAEAAMNAYLASLNRMVA
jgi:hypothetical protein